MKEVYLVSYNACDDEGRSLGYGRVIGIVDDSLDADRMADEEGDFNKNGHIEVRYIGDDGLLYQRDARFPATPVVLGRYEDPEEVRKRALSKLTTAERQALGFSGIDP